MDWLIARLFPGDNVPSEPIDTKQKKKKSITHTLNTGSSSGSTPLASPKTKGLTIDEALFLSICMGHPCGRECTSNMAASLAEESVWDGQEGDTPQHYRRIQPTRRRSTKSQTSQSKKSSTPSGINPPKCITLYQPRQLWPDGTLQILWKKTDKSCFGLTGVDKYEAQMELQMDDLGTVEIESIYSTATVEVHPDETTVQKIGTIVCYMIQSTALNQKMADKHDVPPHIRKLFKQLPAGLLDSWRRNESGDEEGSDKSLPSLQDIHWKHHLHPKSTVKSYLFIENLTVDPRYRGVGLGLCLMEDACRRVADGHSWVLAAPPQQESLEAYFSLMGFASVSRTFTARWNASPMNPRLEEVLPSVPFTAQQSEGQGFQL